jgi:Raf kinase inhibitor-like YbhB/YbcL family protein
MRSIWTAVVLIAVVPWLPAREAGEAAGNVPSQATNAKGDAAMSMTLTSPAFEHGAAIPRKHTGEGADVSPPLKWTDPPPSTAAFVLICDDPDAPGGTWVHWVLYDIPPETRSLDENVPRTGTVPGPASQGLNSFRRVGYGGPMPPAGRPHRYVFTLHAVSAGSGLKPGAVKADVLRAIQGKVLASAELMGTYKR